MGEILSIRAITDAQTKAYSSGLSATCNSLSELRRRLNSYKDASDGIAKLGIVQAAQGVRRVYNYEYWSMKSALDYAEAAATSRPHRKWYGVRRNVRSAAIVESGQVRAMVIEGRKREAISTSAYQSGNKVKFEHQHAPEGKNWAANLLLDTMEWFLATGAVSLAFSGYEIFFAKGSLKENLIKSLAVTLALLIIPVLSIVTDMFHKKPEVAERVLEPQQFMAEARAACVDINGALKSMEREIGWVPVPPGR